MNENKQYTIFFISKIRKKAGKFIENELKRHGINDLAHSHGSILSVLYKNNGKLKMKDIAELIGKDKSTVTQLVNKLSKREYIKKQKSEEDRRITYIALTEKGKNIQTTFDSISQKLIKTAYEGFTEEETEDFLRLLKKLYLNF
ncbi:MarR family winged helix-turn-helix transcriptional regulator [Fuchsiella alkaliacetigena]|uniref:MarR family winged helix-turn-helix transcriptional regulator n=1 Tax=Fuchsiella alkaliacetigena TaxID=957042 RepID=UPI00200A9F6D|nr:MarR family winged helix-turn-helix transcriptional regulator [Fuchsiella alkaliacetigena]MCK8823829.1 MarR family winged helix-turn-helix transcriptional regulator [Fuchsiella alkaliacetigena]